MTPAAPDLPLWAAIPVALLVLTGSLMTLIGAIGLIRLGSFYERVHAPTMGSSAGIACIAIASILCFSVLQSRLAVHEAFIFLLFSITTPVTLMLLMRASLFRDRVEGDSPLSPEIEAVLDHGVAGSPSGSDGDGGARGPELVGQEAAAPPGADPPGGERGGGR